MSLLRILHRTAGRVEGGTRQGWDWKSLRPVVRATETIWLMEETDHLLFLPSC